MSHDMAPPPVEVTVKNWADQNATKPRIQKSTFRTYLLDPAGTNAGKSVQIADYEPTRVRTVIQVYDNPVSLMTESPVISPDTTAAQQTPPVPQGRLMLPDPTIEYCFYGPDALWLNTIQHPSGVVLPTLSGVVDTATATFAAAAAGNLFGPAAGESVAGFKVFFQAPGAAVNADVTLTNVLGGTETFRITIPTTGFVLDMMNLPNPIPAANAAAFPNVNVPAIVGGPAYSIWLQSLKTTTFARVTVTKEYM